MAAGIRTSISIPSRYTTKGTDEIQSIDDNVTFAVQLNKGKSYDFDAIGHSDSSDNGFFDPVLSLYWDNPYPPGENFDLLDEIGSWFELDTSGTKNLIAQDGNGGAQNYDAHIDFTAPATRTYFVEVTGRGHGLPPSSFAGALNYTNDYETGRFTFYATEDDGSDTEPAWDDSTNSPVSPKIYTMPPLGTHIEPPITYTMDPDFYLNHPDLGLFADTVA